jgi:hypothetical protein
MLNALIDAKESNPPLEWGYFDLISGDNFPTKAPK